MIQVEQKQGNAILNNLSQMLPDSQPQSAPEIALIQSRMILGKTVDDLNLQTIIKKHIFQFLAVVLLGSSGKTKVQYQYQDSMFVMSEMIQLSLD